MSKELFSYDYATVAEVTRGILSGASNAAGYKLQPLDKFTSDNWMGASKKEYLKYLTDGYEIEPFGGEIPLPQIRPGNRWTFADEGEEIDIDLALQGEPDCFLVQKPRKAKPGISLLANMSYNGVMPAETISKYGRWVGSAVSTLESMGYEVELAVQDKGTGLLLDKPRTMNVIRIVLSKFGETNLKEWEPMFAPGGYRYLMFTAHRMPAQSHNIRINEGLGHAHRDNNKFDVTWDAGQRELEIHLNKIPFDTLSEKFLKVINENI
jgi:hypothetical protein